MGVCDSFNCDSAIGTVTIPNCGDVDFGQKIVKIFVGKTDAADFADTTALATQSVWQTRLSSTGSTAANFLVAVGDLHNGLKPAAETETQEAPYGGDELVARKHSVTFEIRRWNTTLVTSINNLRCRDQYKVWFLTNTGYLFGGITGFENTSINWGGLEFNGIGNGTGKSTNTMTYFAKDDSVPVSASFLKTLTNT